MQMYYLYILTNKNGSVMYIGMTNDLTRRIHEHRLELVDGFTKRYHVHKLVYVEEYLDPNEAVARERQLKGWTRMKKNRLVETMNPTWDELGDDLF